MDIRTVSRAAAVATLAIAGVANAIPLVVTDNDEAPAVDQFRDYAAHSGVAATSNLMLLALICLVPAMIYAARLARRGAPKLAFIGGGLSALAWLCGLMSIGSLQLALYEGSKLPDQAGAAALVDAITGDPVYNALLSSFVLAHIVGMIILGVALWRSGSVAWWVGALYILYVVLHTVGHAVGPVVDMAAGVVLGLGLLAVAFQIARTPNELWDLPTGADAPARQPVAVA
ncbi:hypothetical protein AB0C02_13395 [Micromonospora sp. NPDC048999]|uniref:hypothetical protein n=1 Tax=Micromonospora sp. NPDC048999 TaxID=3155391 RepID=UPI0033F976EC